MEPNPPQAIPRIPQLLLQTKPSSSGGETATPPRPALAAPDSGPIGENDVVLEFAIRLRIGRDEPLEIASSIGAPGVLHPSMIAEAMRNFETLMKTAIFRPTFVRLKEGLDARVKDGDDNGFPRL